MTATLADPDGSVSSTTWQWERSATRNGTYAAISGATSGTYTPVAADVSKHLRAKVTYTDGHGTGKNAQSGATGAVQQANRPPAFPDQDSSTPGIQTAQTRTVAENTAANANIGAPVAATDADNHTLTYSLGGTDAASFAIVAASGQLQTKAALDYETKRSYRVTVRAADPANTSATATVTINVTDVDEPGVVTLSSSQPRVDSALTATLRDPDATVTGISWQWASSSAANGSYTNISGATSASYTPVAADEDNYLKAAASYTDKFSSNKNAEAVSANAVKFPNRPPAFPDQDLNADGDQKSQTRTVAENTPAGRNIGSPVTATDANNDTLTYSLGGTDASSFAIVAASGQLQTKAVLDYEARSSYTVTVTATDPSNASDTITVTITVTDVDETGTVTLSSAWPRVGAAFTATLNDPDAPVTSVTWVWESSSNQNSWTAIGGAASATYTPVAGVVGKSLRATANYTDKFGANKTAQAVSANAVQQNTVPAFAATNAARSVAENTPAGQNIGAAVAATDPDTSKGDRLTYSLSLSGTDAASFAIVAASGQLQTKAALDYEARSSYTVTVTATDRSSASDTVTVTITVTDVNEPPGKLAAPAVAAASSNGNTTLSATWTAPSNTGRPPITGYDLQYRAGTSGAWTDGPQAVTGTSAQIGGLTAETAYQVRVRAKNDEGDGAWSDPGGGTTTRAVSRSTPPEQPPPPRRRRRSSGGSGGSGGIGVGYHTIITSVNRAPVFTEGNATSRAVAENTASGVNIGLAVKAIDPDGDTLRYTVGGDDGNSFTVNQATGRLRTKSALDFERKSSYKVTMGVFDPKGANDTITVTIRVTDVPDAPLATPPDQIIAVVDFKRETVVSFPDGSATITFPAGTRNTDYQVRLDRNLDNCREDFPEGNLWFCLTVDIFDNQGNLEQGVVLLQPATIRINPNVAERGGAEAVLELHRLGGVNVYTRGPSGVQWGELEFTLEANDTGGVGITIADVRTFGIYAGTIGTAQPAPEPTPTSSPTATPAPEPTPTPVPAPEPQPGPTAVVSNAPEPTPTPQPTAVPIGKSLGIMPPAPSLEDYVPTAEPEAAPEESRLKKDMGWYIALGMMGLATSIAYGGTRYVNRRRKLPLPVVVQRSREFFRW